MPATIDMHCLARSTPDNARINIRTRRAPVRGRHRHDRADNERWDYRITHKDYCNTTACIYGDLALQTSWPGTRLFAYGERV
ncbi:MAG: hypothetical protein HOJ85_06645 [Ilumatobacter sp.]|uniref:hypothetical protein n=1 Tax=Ilumatobacter sp. TaxID=1967498 RepID=UPI001E0418B6|nr:hypothetical protein [Ilumatobacter sp.]MBT5553426.1 hypothetical protein [Ilumatobacter sp.]MBT5865897.1 hypothetical protein [Ilumatobacter sp.]MDG0974915.1 hypothetical protein [Ilumatobacter sp.]